MKLLIKLFFLVILILVGLSLWGIYGVKKEVGSLEWEDVKDHYVAKMKGEAREAVDDNKKKIIKEIEDEIYREATENNPEGDMLPDEIDDTVREKIKENLE